MNSLDIAMRDTLWKQFHKNPEWFCVLGEKLKNYQSGMWPKNLVDCVFQYDWHHPVDIYDIWVLTKFTAKFRSPHREIAVFQVPIGTGPYPDKEIDSNNLQLQTLPAPFTGEFWGGNQDEDGYVKWVKPIHCLARESDETLAWGLIDVHSVPLEVGYNSAGKFWRVLENDGIIARWPYGQRYITVFINLNLIKYYSPETANFDELLASSEETIESCIKMERSPLENWEIP